MKIKKIAQAIKNRTIHYKNILTTSANWVLIKEGPLKGYQIFVNKNLFDGWTKMEYGTYDSFIYDFLSTRNLEGCIIWDVGAHFGYHTLSFANLVGAKGKVLAFEPNKHNLERLRKNINRNINLSNKIFIVVEDS